MKELFKESKIALPDSQLPFLWSVTELRIKALSRIAAFYSSENFQLTVSTKSFDSALRQLHAFQCGLVYCLHVVLLVRRGFQEAEYKCGLLNCCGKECVAGPLTAF